MLTVFYPDLHLKLKLITAMKRIALTLAVLILCIHGGARAGSLTGIPDSGKADTMRATAKVPPVVTGAPERAAPVHQDRQARDRADRKKQRLRTRTPSRKNRTTPHLQPIRGH
jgi:hypothetical protein